MVKLYEFQGKELLRSHGVAVPAGGLASTSEEVQSIASGLGDCVIKAQVLVTGRSASGGVRFAEGPQEAFEAAGDLLGSEIGGAPVNKVLVEERVSPVAEFMASVITDEEMGRPCVLFSRRGGVKVEEIVATQPELLVREPVDILKGFPEYCARNMLLGAGLTGMRLVRLSRFLTQLYVLYREYDARFVEVNPVAETPDGQLVALDCKMAVDDYAIWRHPELGVSVPIETEGAPTELDRIAWARQAEDFRGTFYFIQLVPSKETKKGGYIGFHGIGGGGSISAIGALERFGLRPANYLDTSGNPPASRVYRGAKIVLSQPGMELYCCVSIGVASQNLAFTASGIAKAFMEERPEIPLFVQLVGNRADEAYEILQRVKEREGLDLTLGDPHGSIEAAALKMRAMIDAARGRAV